MASQGQRRIRIFGPSLHAATVVLAFVIVFTLAVVPTPAAPTFAVLHDFTGAATEILPLPV